MRQYFIKKYLYPIPCKLGPLIANHVNSMKDISDGLIGDLTDMLNDKYGALINVNKIPLSVKTKKILSNKNIFRLEDLLNAGDDYGFTQYSLQLSNCWMNINRKGNYNQLHTHSGSMFAGVYYANVPNCCMGKLRFLRDLKDQCLKEYWGCDENFDRHEKQHNYTEWYVQPQNNLMVIFPAWLMHSVDTVSYTHLTLPTKA